MPQIPTNEGRASLLGRGAMLTEASASEFGAGIGAHVSRVGDAVGHSTGVLAQVTRTAKSLDADKYANDAMTELRDYYSKKMADPEFNTKESYADELQQEMQKSLQDWEAKAPTKEARTQFRTQFQRFASGRYESAAITSARTQMDNMLQSHDNQNGSVIRGYETDRLVPDLDANAELMINIKGRFADIDNALGKIAPDRAKALKANLIEDGAYSTMNYSPSSARKILAMGSGLLDGRRVHAIESQIKTAEEAMKTTDLATLHTMVDNRVAQAKLGKQPAKFDLKDIQLYLPDDKAIAMRDKANAQIDTFNTAHSHLTRIQSWSGNEQLKFLEDLQSKAGNDPTRAAMDEDIVRVVAGQVTENIRHYQRDPAGYMIANNPSIKGINDHIKSLYAQNPDSPMIKQKMAERDSILLRLQSAPGEDVVGDAKKQHGVVNRSQVKVMSDSEAQAAVRRINESSPQEALNTIIAEIQQHPGNESIAFNNLVQLQGGDGIKGDYWLVYKNWRNPAAADLVGALQNAKEAKELASESLADFDKALDGYAPWKAWIQTFPSDNNQMEGMLGGMRSGLISYALVQNQRSKMSPELAVKRAVDTWLYSEMAMTSVNGQLIILDRDRKDRPKMQDHEAAAIGRNLGLASQYIPPEDVSLTDQFGRDHFPVLNSIGNESTKMEVLRSMFTTHGFFKPGADGKMATFYLRNDTGTAFEVRDKNGQAFQINIDDMPELSRRISTFMNPSGIDVTKLHDPLKPEVKVTYKQERSPFAFGGYTYQPIYQTNWPMTPKWLKKVQR